MLRPSSNRGTPRPLKHQRNRSASRIMMVQAIICDFDFTLADSSQGVVACVNEALIGLGLPPASAERIHATIGLSLPHTLQALTGIVEAAIATEFTRRFVAHADQVMHGLTLLYPWVAETVQALRAAGQRLGIVSSKYRYRIERSWLRAV